MAGGDGETGESEGAAPIGIAGKKPKYTQHGRHRKPDDPRLRKSREECTLERMERKLRTLDGEDLEAAQQEFFVALLNYHLPVRKRVELLLELAHATDTKRAPVALRAIQEINAATKVREKDEDFSNAPMFVLPATAAISVRQVKTEDAVEAEEVRALPAGDGGG